MKIYVDASTLIALGTVGEFDLVSNFDGEIIVLPAIVDEVTTEPAATNLERFVETNDIQSRSSVTDTDIEQAQSVLNESEQNGDVHLIANVLARVDESVAIVSDDRRVRTVARGLDATVTGTIGVVVRAVEEGYHSDEAKTLIRRIDDNGLHMTGELREKAYTLVDEAAE